MESLSIVGLIDVVYCHYPFSRCGEDGWIEHGIMERRVSCKKAGLRHSTFQYTLVTYMVENIPGLLIEL